MNMGLRWGACVACCLCFLSSGAIGEEAPFVRQLDQIYHKQDGFALTMDHVSPRSGGNGAAIILVMSGGWMSNHEALRPHDDSQLPNAFKPIAEELLKRGYALFYVVHGTQPKFTIREIHEQISSAVRHIRHHAADYKIDGQRMGIMGGSAGGHLSLMQGTHGQDRKDGEGEEAESSRVQAVVAYFPPTDFVNYGKEGVFFDTVVRAVIPDGKDPFLQALDFLEFDPANVRLSKVTDAQRLAEHYQYISPYYHVTADDAPVLLLHGDADQLVPIQQTEHIAEKFAEVGVMAKVYRKPGASHGWSTTAEETQIIADWFDRFLSETKSTAN